MAVLLGICGVGGFSELLDPQSCLTHGPALSPGCPGTCIPLAGVRARSQMVWESGTTGTDTSRAICICAAFPGMLQSSESSSLCSPDGAWPVTPFKGTAVTDQIVPYCHQLSGYLGSAFCFRITSVPILLKEGSPEFNFLLIYPCFWLGVLMQDKFPLLQKSLFPQTPEFPYNENTRACERCGFYQRLKAPSSGVRVSLQGTGKFGSFTADKPSHRQ